MQEQGMGSPNSPVPGVGVHSLIEEDVCQNHNDRYRHSPPPQAKVEVVHLYLDH